MKGQLHRLVVPSSVKAEGDSGHFEGYGSVFNVEDSYAEVVAPGAFEETLKEHAKAGTLPAMLWQHDPGRPVGVYETMKEDDKGLFVAGDIFDDIDDGHRAYRLLKGKALNGLSIGFVPIKWEYDEEQNIRTLTQIDLWEVSIVTFPANPAARVSAVKSAIDRAEGMKDFERILRDAGFAKREAVGLIHRFKEIVGNEREAESTMTNLRASANRLLASMKA